MMNNARDSLELWACELQVKDMMQNTSTSITTEYTEITENINHRDTETSFNGTLQYRKMHDKMGKQPCFQRIGSCSIVKLNLSKNRGRFLYPVRPWEGIVGKYCLT